MDCTEARERMWQPPDQGGENESLRQHLANCATCERMWHEIQPFNEELLSLKIERPSAGFVEQVMQAIEHVPEDHRHVPRHPRRWTTWNHLWVASAATFLLLWLGEQLVDEAIGAPAITVYALKFGWKVTQWAEQIPNLF